MTIDEAIEVFQDDTSETILNLSELRSDELAKWLTELKAYRMYKDLYENGRTDAFQEMIDKCQKYNYTCHSSEFAKVLEEWMNEKDEE